MINKIIKGIIIGIIDNKIIVNCCFKEYMYIKKKLFKEVKIKIKKGSKIYFKIMSINKKGAYKISIKEAMIDILYMKLMNFFKKKKAIKVKIIKETKNGYLADYKKTKCFIPKYEMIRYKIKNYSSYFLIKNINIKKRNIILKTLNFKINKNINNILKNKKSIGIIKVFKNFAFAIVRNIKYKIYNNFYKKNKRITIGLYTQYKIPFKIKEIINNDIFLSPILKKKRLIYRFKYQCDKDNKKKYSFYKKNIAFIKNKEISWLNNNTSKKYMFIKKILNNVKIELCYKKKIYNPWLIFKKNYKKKDKIKRFKLFKKIRFLYVYKIPMGIFGYSIEKIKKAFVIKYLDNCERIVIISNV
ncbi:hypothetical protein [Candidatus Vidania fulgoroideorum]